MTEDFNFFKELIDWIIKISLPLEVNVFIVIISFIAFLTYKSNHIMDTFERFKFMRFKKLENILANENIKPKQPEENVVKKHLLEQFIVEAFNIAHNVRWDKDFQESALEIHNEANNINIRKIKQASSYLFLDDKKIKVKVDWFEYYFLHLINMLSLLFLLYALALILLTYLNLIANPLSENIQTIHVVTYVLTFLFKLAMGVFIFFIAILMSKEYNKLNTAKDIDTCLINLDTSYKSEFSKHNPKWSVYLFWIIFIIEANFIISSVI